MNNLIQIEITPLDAELFLKFQKHHELFKLLVEKGVFDQKSAGVVINFDKDGNIGTIERHDILYNKRNEIDKM